MALSYTGQTVVVKGVLCFADVHSASLDTALIIRRTPPATVMVNLVGCLLAAGIARQKNNLSDMIVPEYRGTCFLAPDAFRISLLAEIPRVGDRAFRVLSCS